MIRVLMLTLLAAAMITLMSVSDVSAQGRGRGHGNGRWGNKCDKFVNCHDARDGRWDNRGPRRRLSLRTRYYSRYENNRVNRWHRNRRVYGDRFYVRTHRRY